MPDDNQDSYSNVIESFVDVFLKVIWFLAYFFFCAGFIHAVWHNVLLPQFPVLPKLSYWNIYLMFISLKLVFSAVPFTSNINISSTHISTTDSGDDVVKTTKEY